MSAAALEERKRDNFADDLGIDLGDDDDFEEDLKSAAKFNQARQSSQLMIDGVDNRIRVRESIEGTDKVQPGLIYA